MSKIKPGQIVFSGQRTKTFLRPQNDTPAKIKQTAVLGAMGFHSGDMRVSSGQPKSQPASTTKPSSRVNTPTNRLAKSGWVKAGSGVEDIANLGHCS
jgi:hypothetical protein